MTGLHQSLKTSVERVKQFDADRQRGREAKRMAPAACFGFDGLVRRQFLIALPARCELAEPMVGDGGRSGRLAEHVFLGQQMEYLLTRPERQTNFLEVAFGQ